jgi:beta-glucosidase
MMSKTAARVSDGPNRRGFLSGVAALAGLAVTAPRAFARASDRIEGLLAQMTIEEKAGQLSCFADMIRPPIADINPLVNMRNAQTLLAEIKAGRIGALFNGVGAQAARDTQKAAIEGSRLKIPLLFAADVIHGFRTVFPIPLGETASFDPHLAERTARATALEATASGLHWTFAPMVDVARDQRWGRVAEGSGEDVFLGEMMAAARVRGFQGKDLKADDSMLATPKHFAAYGAVTAGLEYNSVELSDATLREVHLPPFQAAFGAGAMTVMSAFNDVNGIPATANKMLLTDILRGEWGFKGVVVSDYTADQELVAHGFAADDRDAARLAILAGVDMSMQSGLYNRYLPELVASGAVPMAVVDASVRRVLALKEAIGLFDNPYRSLDPRDEATRTATPAMRALSREAGARSVVLLKNERALLPLPKAGKRLALIGPFADDRDNVLGAWGGFFADRRLNVDLATGLRAQLADPGGLIVERGCEVETTIAGGFERAVAAAQASDIVLLAIGESQDMTGEAKSRTDIRIPPVQMRLAEAIAATDKPVIVLLRHGRAIQLEGVVRDAPAILATWFLGSEMGNAVADVLFGAVNPSGKLPVSFPIDSGQEPFFYNGRTTGRPAPADPNGQEYKARWRSIRNDALYPFGFGLSYTRFDVTDMKLSTARLAWTDTLHVSAKVKNSGNLHGDHVLQLYIRDRVASRTRPVRELKGFQRVSLTPGAEREVRFELKRENLMFVGDNDYWIAEPGMFDVWLANSSVDGLVSSFELLAAGQG